MQGLPMCENMYLKVWDVKKVKIVNQKHTYQKPNDFSFLVYLSIYLFHSNYINFL